MHHVIRILYCGWGTLFLVSEAKMNYKDFYFIKKKYNLL